MSISRIRVLLIEDNRLLREGITKMLNAEEDIKVMSSSGNGDALEKARKLAPDVVLLELGSQKSRQFDNSWTDKETVS